MSRNVTMRAYANCKTMFNILPPQQKTYLTHEYSVRLIVVLLAIISLAAIFLFGSLFPAYFLSLSKEHTETVALEEVQRRVAAVKVPPHTSFLELKAISDAVDKSSSGISARTIIGEVVDQKGIDIRITGFDINTTIEGGHSLTVVGIAATRESIQSFKKRLELRPLFKKVVVPLSNFQKNKDIQFTINITIAS